MPKTEGSISRGARCSDSALNWHISNIRQKVYGMAQKGTTVIVVEDEVIVRMDIAMSLQDEGFIVLEASNADEAIDLLDAHPEIRLMFTDIDMPGSMDGLKLAEAVRDRWPPVKIIIASGHRELRDDLLPIEGKFFSKPYDHARIISAMREMLAPR